MHSSAESDDTDEQLGSRIACGLSHSIIDVPVHNDGSPDDVLEREQIALNIDDSVSAGIGEDHVADVAGVSGCVRVEAVRLGERVEVTAHSGTITAGHIAPSVNVLQEHREEQKINKRSNNRESAAIRAS